LTEGPRDDSEQVQATFGAGLWCDMPVIWQDFDIATGAARIGHCPLAQQNMAAQQVFPLACAASDTTPCVQPSTNVTNRIQAFCPRSIDLFYHAFPGLSRTYHRWAMIHFGCPVPPASALIVERTGLAVLY